jgi:hypothetical protein
MRGNTRARQKFLKERLVTKKVPFLEMPDQVLFFSANLLLFLTTCASLGNQAVG